MMENSLPAIRPDVCCPRARTWVSMAVTYRQTWWEWGDIPGLSHKQIFTSKSVRDGITQGLGQERQEHHGNRLSALLSWHGASENTAPAAWETAPGLHFRTSAEKFKLARGTLVGLTTDNPAALSLGPEQWLSKSEQGWTLRTSRVVLVLFQFQWYACMHAHLLQSCLTLCDSYGP